MIKYFKTLWENNITPVNGRNLNKIEDALEYLYDVIRNVPSEENIRIANEKQRQKDETTRSNSEIKRNATFDSKIKDVDKAINASNENIVEVNNKFESITASKQQDAEVIIARDGEESLNNRLKRDLYVDNIPLKQKVLDIEGLKEMQDLEYETDNGYKVCQNTKNGVVKDLKISGKSLVNLAKPKNLNITPPDVNMYYINDDSKNMFSQGEYTLVNTTNKKITFGIRKISDNSYVGDYIVSNGCKLITLGDDQFIRTIVGIFADGWQNNDIDKELLKKVVILKGNHTQNPPSYFEGIASVGNGNEIEVLSNNENYFNFNNFYYKKDTISYEIVDSNTIKVSKVNGASYDYTGFRVKLIPNKKYSIGADLSMSDNCGIGIKDINGTGLVGDVTMIANKREFVVPSDGIVEIRFYPTLGTTGNATMVANNIYIKSFENTNNFVKTKQDKKPILFKDADGNWKPVTELNEFDILDSTRKKLYKNGSIIDFKGASDENWILSGSSSTTLVFKISSPSNSDATKEVICNSFGFFRQAWDVSKQKEGIEFDSNGNVYVQILKTKLTTLDANGFKTWLQSNPTTVVYALLKALVYDVSPTDTEAFENETMWMIESGPVSPHAEFKVTSSIQNFAKNTAERVDRLEDEVYKMNLANFAVSLNALELKSRLEALEAPQK